MTEFDFKQGLNRLEANFGKYDEEMRSELWGRFRNYDQNRWNRMITWLQESCDFKPKVKKFMEASRHIAGQEERDQSDPVCAWEHWKATCTDAEWEEYLIVSTASISTGAARKILENAEDNKYRGFPEAFVIHLTEIAGRDDDA